MLLSILNDETPITSQGAHQGFLTPHADLVVDGVRYTSDDPACFDKLEAEARKAGDALREALGYPLCEKCDERVSRTFTRYVTTCRVEGGEDISEPMQLCAGCAGASPDEISDWPGAGADRSAA